MYNSYSNIMTLEHALKVHIDHLENELGNYSTSKRLGSAYKVGGNLSSDSLCAIDRSTAGGYIMEREIRKFVTAFNKKHKNFGKRYYVKAVGRARNRR